MDLALKKQSDWELLASGGGRKLERFGSVIIERPAPQAVWKESDSTSWDRAGATFRRKSDGSGSWDCRGASQPSWDIRLLDVSLQLRLTGFGNVGVFPEHAVHWPWMKELLLKKPGAEVLNLFSYTGGASVFCAEQGARVTHVDSAKSVNTWAGLNARASGVEAEKIRFITDDALKFAKREQRRNRKYHGIILDPPTFGRGSKGEVWKVERDFIALLDVCKELLLDNALFVLITSHSPGITPAVLRAMLSGVSGRLESGEMLLAGKGPELPAGAYARITCNPS